MRVSGLIGAVLLAIFLVQRLAILLAMAGRFSDAGAQDVMTAFATGLRFDAVVIGMVLVPALILLLPAPPAWLSARWFRRTAACYGGLAAAAVAFGSVADFFYFQEFGQRLDEKVLRYVGYDYVQLTILTKYPVIPAVLGGLVLFALVYWLIRRFGFDRYHVYGSLVDAVVWSALLIAAVVLAIRGSVGPKPINTGPAFFSDSASVTQLSLNWGFTLREAIISKSFRSKSLDRLYDVLPEPRATELARKAVPGEGFVSGAPNPLVRTHDTGRPRRRHNVVLVVLESLGWHYVGALGGKGKLTPNLDRLADHGLLMDRCFAVGPRTTRGFSGLVSAFPDLPGDSVTTRSRAEGDFLTLGTVLRDRGYETMFIYGGQPHYDHRQAFLGSNGYDRLIFGKEFSSRTFRTFLGWCDGDLFRSAHAHLKTAEEPFFATLLTLSFHEPFQIPEGKIDRVPSEKPHAAQLDAVRYTDWAVGRFMEMAREADYFDRTLFVFVADSPGGAREHPRTIADFRVPFLIYAPKILGEEGRRVSAVCSQTDVAPTLLSLLGGSYKNPTFGSSVLDRSAGEGMALVQPGDDQLAMIDGDQNVVVVPPHGGSSELFRYEAPDTLRPVDTTEGHTRQLRARLERRAVAVLQTAQRVFRRDVYRWPPSEREPLPADR